MTARHYALWLAVALVAMTGVYAVVAAGATLEACAAR